MPYVRRTWQNAPSSATPLNAAALNNIEDGVEEAVEAVTGRLSEANLENTIGAGFTERGYAGKFGGRQAIDRLLDQAYAPIPAADLPVITFSTTSQVTGTRYTPKRIGDVGSANADMTGDTRMRYLSVPPLGIEAWGVSPTAGVLGSLLPGGSASARRWLVWPEFETGAQVVEYEWRAPSDNKAPLLIEVNGRAHQAQVYSSGLTGSGTRYMQLTFPAAAWRRISIALGGDPFYAIKVPTGQVILRPNEAFKKTIAVIGDSITNGASADTWGAGTTNTWAYRVAKILGADNVILAGIGGTKWVQSGSGDVALSHFAGRLTQVLATNPDVLVFMGSQNDDAATLEQRNAIQAAVESTLALCVDVPEVYVIGTIRSLNQNAPVQAGTLAAGRVFVDISDAIWGTGWLGSTTGNGNADVFTGDSAQHPTFAGHRHLERKILAAIADATS